MKNLARAVFVVMSWLVVTAAGQALDKVPYNKYLGPVTLEMVCRSKDQSKFVLSNNTKWAIEVRTTSLYADARKYGTFKSDDGSSLLVLNDQQVLSDLFYWVLEERRIRKQSYFTVISMAGDTGAGSWIAPGRSVYFWVPSKYTGSSDRVFVKFNYAWEIGGTGVMNPGYVEHRVYDETSTIINTKCEL